jgi:transcription initiation factor IIE alpha subunit
MKQKCPYECNAYLKPVSKTKEFYYNGNTYFLEAFMYECPICGQEVGTIDQAADIQKKMKTIIEKENMRVGEIPLQD